MTLRVVLATSNPGKVKEIREIFGDAIEAVTLPMWLGDVETGTTYLENARLKAAAAVRMLREPVLAEDAGLEVDALGGLPGLRSARFAGYDHRAGAGKAKLLELMTGVPPTKRTARFRAVAVLLFPSGHEVVGTGVVEGSIATERRGSGGFGYDPVFVPAGQTRTAAELAPDEKNVISHRALALGQLVANLQRISGP